MKACNKTVALHIGVGQNFQALQTFCKEILNLTKTSNYDLNQWDAGDRVLREDFNADNATIDAALAAADAKLDSTLAQIMARQHFQTITEIPIPATGGRNANLTLPSINWSHYYYVIFEFAVTGTGEGMIYMNGTSGGQSYQIGASSSKSGLAAFSTSSTMTFLFMPHYSNQHHVSGLFLYGGLGCASSNVKYADWKTLYFSMSDSSYSLTGGKILVRGVR